MAVEFSFVDPFIDDEEAKPSSLPPDISESATDEEDKQEDDFEFIDPFLEEGVAFATERDTTTISKDEDLTTEGVAPFEFVDPFERSDKDTDGTQDEPEVSKVAGSPDDWIKKYQQVNPGVSKEEAIEEGKRLGKIPKDFVAKNELRHSSEKSGHQPRGIRNNNPGNIEKSDIPWRGKVEGSDKRFETFETPEDGIRAMTVNLRTYFNKYGLNTVEGIISRWAPPSENITPAYVKEVAKRLGVSPDKPINLNNPKIMRKLVEAIIQHENGKMPYDDRTLSKGVSAALA